MPKSIPSNGATTAKSKRSCCMPQKTGIKVIAIVSSVTAILILLVSSILLLLRSTEHNVDDGQKTTTTEKSSKFLHSYTVKKYLYTEPQAISIMQIFSSMCLYSSSDSEFRKFSLIWIIFHTVGIFVNSVYLWNLASWTTTKNHQHLSPGIHAAKYVSVKSSMENNDNNNNIIIIKPADNDNIIINRQKSYRSLILRLTTFLLNFIGLNLLVEIFSILVLIEFMRHPQYSSTHV